VKKAFLSAAALAAIVFSCLGATPAKSKKKRHPAATSSTTVVRKHAVSAKTSAKGSKTSAAAAKRKGTKAGAVSRSYQQAPSMDRYREIQQALAAKGCFHGEPNGQWGPDSIDALKQFQTQQNLMPDGKIGSLSLIALGLGPKRLTAKSDSTPPPATALPSPAAPPQPQ
jgi:peptidoglycan hydrolase-like protein with peptidoglycan-binding domain